MRQRRWIMLIIAHNLQAPDVVRCRLNDKFATADDCGMALLTDPALEALHVNQAREALIRRARRPLAVSLHQGSHEFFTHFRSGGAGCPLLTPQPPHAS